MSFPTFFKDHHWGFIFSWLGNINNWFCVSLLNLSVVNYPWLISITRYSLCFVMHNPYIEIYGNGSFSDEYQISTIENIWWFQLWASNFIVDKWDLDGTTITPSYNLTHKLEFHQRMLEFAGFFNRKHIALWESVEITVNNKLLFTQFVTSPFLQQ